MVVVVFMEWNETARRQTWTTEPVFSCHNYGTLEKYAKMVGAVKRMEM